MSRFVLGFAAASVFGLQALASTVHLSNGTQIWTSTNGGTSFVQTDAAATVTGGAGIVGLGQHHTLGFFATTSDGWLHTVTGLGTSNVVLTQFKYLGGSTISFDFFGNNLRGMRGNDLIQLDVSSNANSVSVINPGTGLNSVPATARVGNNYFGMTANGNFYQINNAGAATQIGANNVTGLNGADVAGGSSNSDYSRMFVAAGFEATNDFMKFGWINHADGVFTQIGLNHNIGEIQGSMGMVMVVPLPQSAAMGLAGLVGVGLFARLRRR